MPRDRRTKQKPLATNHQTLVARGSEFHAERAGFEPAVGLIPYTDLADRQTNEGTLLSGLNLQQEKDAAGEQPSELLTANESLERVKADSQYGHKHDAELSQIVAAS